MEMNRKTFLQFLTGIVGWPQAALPGEPAPGGPLALVSYIAVPPKRDLWLEDWQAALRSPILDSQDSKERLFIRALRLNRPVDFIYHGGSQGGARRHVHPLALYRVQGHPAAYLAAYCRARQEIRTFRLDRVELEARGLAAATASAPE
jgi:hypothetical protein